MSLTEREIIDGLKEKYSRQLEMVAKAQANLQKTAIALEAFGIHVDGKKPARRTRVAKGYTPGGTQIAREAILKVFEERPGNCFTSRLLTSIIGGESHPSTVHRAANQLVEEGILYRNNDEFPVKFGKRAIAND